MRKNDEKGLIMNNNFLYYKGSIDRIINTCINKYQLPETVAEKMKSTLSEKLYFSKSNIEDSFTVNGIKYDWKCSCYKNFIRGPIFNIEIRGKEYQIIMDYDYCGDDVGSVLRHFYFEQYNKLYIEASMTEESNIRPCEYADKHGIDSTVLLRRQILFTKMLYKDNETLLPGLKQLQDDFIRDNLLENGACYSEYKTYETGILIKEDGNIIYDNVYKCTIPYNDGKVVFYIDKEFKAHLKLENDKKNNLTFKDIPQNILDIVREKIGKAKKLGADTSDIKLTFQQAQQEAKEKTTNGTTVVGSEYGDR